MGKQQSQQQQPDIQQPVLQQPQQPHPQCPHPAINGSSTYHPNHSPQHNLHCYQEDQTFPSPQNNPHRSIHHGYRRNMHKTHPRGCRGTQGQTNQLLKHKCPPAHQTSQRKNLRP